MKKPFLIANWKAHPATVSEAKVLFSKVKKRIARISGVEFRAAVPQPFLHPLSENKSKKIILGSEDVSAVSGGAHTGEVTALMALSAGARFSIIGHSERRALGESNELINKKMLAALGAGLEVVLCIGERERDLEGRYLSFVSTQLDSALANLLPRDLSKILIAYEPVFAIGKREEDAMKSNDVQEMVIFIRKFLTEKFNRSRAEGMPIIYGGSVERDNAADLLEHGGVQGFLLGHASLDPDMFADIGRIVQKA